MGAEYCSFCAAERWALVVALSRFGTFTGLRNMQSSSTSAFPEIQSFSFDGATYRSPYVAFTGIEEYSDVPGIDGIFTRIAFPTAAQQGTLDRYGPIAVPGWTARSGGDLFPFVDVANRAVIGTSQFSPAAIVGQSQAGIAGRLDDPTAVADQGGGGLGQLPDRSHLHGHRSATAQAVRLQRGPRRSGLVDRLLTVAAPAGPVQPARRSTNCLRSSSFRPPQIPWGSRMRMA